MHKGIYALHMEAEAAVGIGPYDLPKKKSNWVSIVVSYLKGTPLILCPQANVQLSAEASFSVSTVAIARSVTSFWVNAELLRPSCEHLTSPQHSFIAEHK
jgi:hypothetical protein